MNTVQFITSFYDQAYARLRGQASARGDVYQHRTNKRKFSGASEQGDQASRPDDQRTTRRQARAHKRARLESDENLSHKVPLTCRKCGQVKSADYFPGTTTHAGLHGQTCFDCWDDYVFECLDDDAALNLSCMWCEWELLVKDIQEVCRKAVFRKYERQASKETIQNTTEACPNPICGVRIEKVEGNGCAHMVCLCGHEFCWLCRVGWDSDPTSLVHLRGCEMFEIARGYLEASDDAEMS
ncbi:hypothetical protein EJ03DRAFT_168914 [Teratosphaeria nubilosa]|uniref:IBR domain-containing protein n=1 Tax=Teratosphaeria nubilosa TaxID=161662 RepID=A0A6G1LIC4_9PEZI|nr:hypothetical protein EJ03DRAFT_168914 [Teratosphaeria nubilosa]